MIGQSTLSQWLSPRVIYNPPGQNTQCCISLHHAASGRPRYLLSILHLHSHSSSNRYSFDIMETYSSYNIAVSWTILVLPCAHSENLIHTTGHPFRRFRLMDDGLWIGSHRLNAWSTVLLRKSGSRSGPYRSWLRAHKLYHCYCQRDFLRGWLPRLSHCWFRWFPAWPSSRVSGSCRSWCCWKYHPDRLGQPGHGMYSPKMVTRVMSSYFR